MVYYDDTGHLISDKSLLELHDFATKIGLRREWFHDRHSGDFCYPHYDLTTDKSKNRAYLNGAKRIGIKEIVEKLENAPYQKNIQEVKSDDA